MATITDRELAAVVKEAKRTGKEVWIRDGAKARGIGRVEFRARPNGRCMAYFRYTNSSGTRDRLELGDYDPARGGLRLRELYAKAAEYSKLYQGGNNDLRAHLERQSAEEKARIEAAAREREEHERQAKSGTTRALLEGYIAHLERRRKPAFRDARNLFANHVYKAFPDLAAMPARQLTREHASTILARLINDGHGRSAAKLRSYARAAWSCAMDARADPDIHPALHGFHVDANPFAAVPSKSLAKYNRAVDRTLTETELRAFLKALKAEPDNTVKDVLSLSLLLGGQRISQLVRATPADIDVDEQTITLYDPKGARQQPRPHRLPLTKRAAAIVERRLALRDKAGEALPYLFTNNGSVPVRMETVSNAVTEICKAMVEAKSISTPFSLRDIRRTCETMLERMGVSKDMRAQILSHGLGGVQDRHYDWHSYMPEKRSALERWDARLVELTRKTRKPTNVVPLRARRA